MNDNAVSGFRALYIVARRGHPKFELSTINYISPLPVHLLAGRIGVYRDKFQSTHSRLLVLRACFTKICPKCTLDKCVRAALLYRGCFGRKSDNNFGSCVRFVITEKVNIILIYFYGYLLIWLVVYSRWETIKLCNMNWIDFVLPYVWVKNCSKEILKLINKWYIPKETGHES